MIIGTVKGDLYDIGKNLVMMMVEGAGFKVVDLGVDVSVEKFVQAVEEHQPRVVRVPTSNVSVVDLVAEPACPATVDQINAASRKPPKAGSKPKSSS